MAGHYPLKMTDLSALYKASGFNDAETYIQSGNVVFTCDENLSVIGAVKKIEESLLEKFGYNVPVMIRTVDGLKKIAKSNPFIQEEKFDPSKCVAILLYEDATEDQILKMKGIDYPPDKFEIIGSEVFVYCPNGFGRSKLYTNFFEKKMGVTGTARNWRTIVSILELAAKK
jgi:uncharacterized protein (DUF1697 family)